MKRDRVSWPKARGGHRIRLEAATICQLACPSCPRTQGIIKAQIGAGFLKFDKFRRIVDENPRISEIELSNWGEIFLNPSSTWPPSSTRWRPGTTPRLTSGSSGWRS